MIRRGTTILAAATALCMTAAWLDVDRADAFTSLQLKCRETIAKRGEKLSDTISKTLTTCHRKRATGSLPGSTQCSDLAQADPPKNKVAKAEDKLISQVTDKCAGNVPSEISFTGCPFPCELAVPTITTMADVAECLVCVVRDAGQVMSSASQGAPPAPLGDAEERCHTSIGKSQRKHLKTIVKERVKCQKSDEKNGAEDTSNCSLTDPKQKIQRARDKAEATLTEDCADADLLDLESCSTTSLGSLVGCVLADSDAKGELVFQALYNLAPGGGPTTTMGTTTSTVTSTTTTTTLGGVQDPLCPDKGELVLRSGVTTTTCASNGDCAVGTCDDLLGLCVTVTELDTGWTGIAHDAGINDLLITVGDLFCTGPGPVCGQCSILGINPEPGYCRCANDNRAICDEPFQADADDCGGSICDCYLGAPLPLSAGNTPACVLNRFATDATGTANVDTGAGVTNTALKSVVHLGENLILPCPVCGGTCTAGKVVVDCGTNSDCNTPGASNGVCSASICTAGKVVPTCGVDIHCDTTGGAGDGVCDNFDTTPDDGVREGLCHKGANLYQSCDVTGVSSTFPAPDGIIASGSGMSLDCFPDAGKNVSGGGLSIVISQSTGTQNLSVGIECGFPPTVNWNCHCSVCSGGGNLPCNSNADCPNPKVCQNLFDGKPSPNQCSAGVCNDAGGGEGVCDGGPNDKSCDGIVRGSGEGFISCANNAECAVGAIGIDAGECTLTKPRECFLDTITATGMPDPTAPIGVATFCIPPTANDGINVVAGLPGPGRVVNQGQTRTFCASNPAIEYVPGVGGCP